MFETRKAIREAAVEKAVEKKLDHIVASWEQLRTLSQDEVRQKIFEVDQRSSVNGP